MQIAAIITFAVAVALGVFAWWGMFSAAGRQRFDEMAGMIPLLAGVIAIVLMIIGVILFGISVWRSH